MTEWQREMTKTHRGKNEFPIKESQWDWSLLSQTEKQD